VREESLLSTQKGVSQYSRRTNTRIYKSNVLSVLLYGSECWKISKKDGDSLKPEALSDMAKHYPTISNTHNSEVSYVSLKPETLSDMARQYATISNTHNSDGSCLKPETLS